MTSSQGDAQAQTRAGLTPRGAAVFTDIAGAVGEHGVDVEDEHARWFVYWKAAPEASLRALLLEVVGEGEQLQRPVVTEVLKYVDDVEGERWVGLLAGEDREFAERRRREWALIRELETRPRTLSGETAALSPWCQRRLIERISDDVVLRDLAEHGASRKIRHMARERMRLRKLPAEHPAC
ncbi:hypothetical protein GCM10010413_16400 [Promicromonospora sukumoe]|uniref:Uncharacterized protein n=1 Tax=Promicromonospora sukumoe TaxID=88382 RepID=A0A7W3JAF2_9MICO|nr:hypothetical protein [Promicromonospora sukumoe]MBA8809139.1 hypothetical protein [Promicromonospora sukumoe]